MATLGPGASASERLQAFGTGEFMFVRFRLGWPLERVVDAWCEFVGALTASGTR